MRKHSWLTKVGLFLAGIVLIGMNIAWIWALVTGEEKILKVILGIFLLAFVIYAIYTLYKSKKSSK